MSGKEESLRRIVALALALFLSLGAPFADYAMAATRLVSVAGADSGDCTISPCRSISYAAAVSAAGDTINVGPGTYSTDTEFFPIPGSNLVIQGAGEGLSIIDSTPALVPVVSPGFGLPAFYYYDEQTAATKLDGFTIIAQNHPAISIMSMASSAPTISNNTITATTSAAGIAIYVTNPFYSAAVTLSPTITGNTIESTSGGGGIGFFRTFGLGPSDASSGAISGSTVTGGALRSGSYTYYYYYPPSPGTPASIAVSGTISGNTISGGFFGVGMNYFYSYYGYVGPKALAAPDRSASCCGPMAALDFAPTISGNTISSTSMGVLIYDVVYSYYYSSTENIRPLITGNTIEAPDFAGIEIVLLSFGGASVINATIADNEITDAGSGILIGGMGVGQLSATLSNNTVTGTFTATPYGYYSINAGALFQAMFVSDAAITVDHNTISGFETGIIMFGTIGDSTITNNSITGNQYTGVILYDFFRGPTSASAGKSASRALPMTPTSLTMSNNTITGSQYATTLYGYATYYGATPVFDLGGGSLGSTGKNTFSGSTSDLENISPSAMSAMSNWFSDTPVIVENPGAVTYSALENQLSISMATASGIKDGSAAFAITAASEGTFFQTGIGSAGMPNNAVVTFGGKKARFIGVTPDGKTLTGLAPATTSEGTVDVVVTNPGGQTGSIEGAFTYLPSSPNSPTAPTLVYPYDGASGLDPNGILFQWLVSVDADGDVVAYDLYVCEDATFESCPAPVNSVRVASLESGALYASAGGLGSLGLLLTGIALAGGLSRRRRVALMVLVAMLVAIAGMTLSSCGISGSGGGDLVSYNYEVGGLDSNTTYYWKVVAYDGTGNLTESSVYSFTTQ